MKLLTVVGARPQFIKAAPFSDFFRKNHKEVLVHTGQHYDPNMSEIFFKELDIPKPDYNLCIGSGSHGVQTGEMLKGIEIILSKENPDAMLVYGDTNSTISGALAASKLHIPVIHVEAGLRSYNKKMPEEINRVVTDHLSDQLFCPTQSSILNLKNEGITKNVFYSGDIMYDAVLRNINVADELYNEINWKEYVKAINISIDSISIGDSFYLATIHRAENTDDNFKLKEIFSTLDSLDTKVLMPIHPRTRNLLKAYDIVPSNVVLIEPVGYLLMLFLIKYSKMIITDSGGLQKEAFFLKTPCTTLRNQTEWIETLDDGWNILSEISKDSILRNVMRPKPDRTNLSTNAFGNGNAAKIISDLITANY